MKTRVHFSRKGRSKKRRHATEMERETIQRFCMVIVLATSTHGRIPQAQDLFNAYIKGCFEYLTVVRGVEPNPRGQMLGLTAQDLTDLGTWYGKWVTGNSASPGLWEIHENAFTASSNDKNDGDVAKFMEDFGDFFRTLLNIMAANRAIDSADRIITHIKEIDGTKTFRAVPTDRAVEGAIHKVLSLQHTLRVTDPDNPDTKEQPEGVQATRVYRAIKDQGIAPAATDYILIGDTTSFEYLSKFTSADIGKRAHYYGVWIDSKRTEGVKGNNFSETVI